MFQWALVAGLPPTPKAMASTKSQQTLNLKSLMENLPFFAESPRGIDCFFATARIAYQWWNQEEAVGSIEGDVFVEQNFVSQKSIATATVNFRLLPGDEISEAIEQVRQKINDERIKISNANSFLAVASTVTSTNSFAFRKVYETIKKTSASRPRKFWSSLSLSVLFAPERTP